MSKYIYLYLNQEDLNSLLPFFRERGLFFYNKNGEAIEEVIAIGQCWKDYYIGNDDNKKMFIYSCCDGGGKRMIQPGSFVLNSETDALSKKIFSQLKKYIVANYKLRKAKDFYIGAGIYRDWLDGKYYVPDFDYDNITVEKEQAERIIELVEQEGYIIKNEVRMVGSKEKLSLKDVFVIYDKESKLIETFEDSSEVKVFFEGDLQTTYTIEAHTHIEGESDCVFVTPRKKKFEFSLNAKLKLKTDSRAVKIFEFIKSIADNEELCRDQ